jgi:hypothetical protein
MRQPPEISKGGAGPEGSNPSLSAPPTTESDSVFPSGTAPCSVPEHMPDTGRGSGAPSGPRFPVLGDVVEICLATRMAWEPAKVVSIFALSIPAAFRVRGADGQTWICGGRADVPWRWPQAEAAPVTAPHSGEGTPGVAVRAFACSEAQPGDAPGFCAAHAVGCHDGCELACEAASGGGPFDPSVPTTPVTLPGGAQPFPPASDVQIAPVVWDLEPGARSPVDMCRCNHLRAVHVEATCSAAGCGCAGFLLVVPPAPPAPFEEPAVSDAAAEAEEAAGVRKCGELVDDTTSTGRAVRRECGSVITGSVHCYVCGDVAKPHRPGATRCYAHCGSVCHYGAPIVASASFQRFAWVVVGVGTRFAGEVRLYGEPGRAPTLVKRADGRTMWEGGSASELAYQLAAFVADLIDEGQAPDTRLPYVAPTVRELTPEEAVAILRRRAPGLLAGIGAHAKAPPEDRGDETCSEADGFDPDEWAGWSAEACAEAFALTVLPLARGVKVRNELRMLILNAQRTWAELEEWVDEGNAGCTPAETVTRARALHTAILCAALAAAGGLR